MKKYLMRGGMSPLDNMTVQSVLQNNSVGGNTGNLLYAYSVFRSLMDEETKIDVDYYGVERFFDEKDIDKINQEYDAYICPLADAFRDSFIPQMEKYTAFFKRLKIPCHIIGVGIRTPYEPDIKAPHKFDYAVKEFMKAVLDRTSVVGLRGEFTGEYLKKLGFREELDYTVIGCPSMYAKGRNLAVHTLDLTTSSKISFNMSNRTTHDVMSFMFRQMNAYHDHFVVAQNIRELRLLYDGTEYAPNPMSSPLLPQSSDHILFRENRYRSFYNIPTWLSFMEQMNLSVGSRLHGNVAALLAGCPALFILQDGRMRELATYHKLPSVPANAIRESDCLPDLLQRVDLSSHLKCITSNFERYVSFLNRNEISNNYRRDLDCTEIQLDKAMSAMEYRQISVPCKGESVF